MDTTQELHKKANTSFNLDNNLLNKFKYLAKSNNKSLNNYVENIPSTSLQERITKGIEEYENGEAIHMAKGETINQFLHRLIAE